MWGIGSLVLGPHIISSLFVLAMRDEGESKRLIREEAPITAVHVPSGLDSKDEAQFIIEGEFPNTCFTLGELNVRAGREELKQGVIKFHLEALRHQRDNCLEIKTPFTKVVNLGVLPHGNFEIRHLKSLKRRATLHIQQAKVHTVDEVN